MLGELCMGNSKIKIEKFKEFVNHLTDDELERVVDEIFAKLITANAKYDRSSYALNDDSTLTTCKKCGGVHIVKNGKDKNGHRRYLCRDCGITFTANTGTVISCSHKSVDVWKKYISLLLNGATIEQCKKECLLSTQTAFTWRHKILNALSDSSFAESFNGLLEMDEMYVRISYKGNHKKSKNFVMPRAPFKRGSDNRISGSNSKASVLCVVERNGSFSGKVVCVGMLNMPLLRQTFDNKISDESIILTDGLRAYGQYFKTIDAEHIVLPSNNHKPTVKGAYHINNVNALHSRFRIFLSCYKGVSTKYLHNYLALFIWKENNKTGNRQELLQQKINCANSYISSKTLRSIAPTPAFAPAV